MLGGKVIRAKLFLCIPSGGKTDGNPKPVPIACNALHASHVFGGHLFGSILRESYIIICLKMKGKVTVRKSTKQKGSWISKQFARNDIFYFAVWNQSLLPNLPYPAIS